MHYLYSLASSFKTLVKEVSHPERFKDKKVKGTTIPKPCRLGKAIRLVATGGFDFRSRSVRTEFTLGYLAWLVIGWLVYLAVKALSYGIVFFLAVLFGDFMGKFSGDVTALVIWLILLIIIMILLFLPILALVVRRLHDINPSKPEFIICIILYLVPLVRFFVFMLLAVTPSYKGDNGREFRVKMKSK